MRIPLALTGLCLLFGACAGYTANLSQQSVKPATPMIAKAIEQKLFVVIDPDKVPDTFSIPNTPNRVVGFRPFLETSIRKALSTFFVHIAFVPPSFEAPDHLHLLADFKLDPIEVRPVVQDGLIHEVLHMNWAFAIRASDQKDYLFSFAGVGKSDLSYPTLDMGCQQLMTSILHALLKDWADKDVFASLSAPRDDKPTPATGSAPAAVLAVFDVQDASKKINPATLVQITTYLGTLLTESGRYSVVPRDQLRKRLLDEKKGTYRQCMDESCQIELGKSLAANKTLATTLIRVGGKCAVTANLFDLKTETAQKGASVQTGCEQDALLGAMRKIAAQLAAD